jgi:hypothetical protein
VASSYGAASGAASGETARGAAGAGGVAAREDPDPFPLCAKAEEGGALPVLLLVAGKLADTLGRELLESKGSSS